MARRGADRAAAKAALPLRLFSQTQASASDADSESLAAAAVAAHSEALAIVNANGRLLHINPAGSSLFPAAFIGRKFSDVLTLDLRLALETALAQAWLGTPGRFECQAAQNGPWLEFAVSSFRHRDEPHALIAIRNVDAQRLAQDRLRRSERNEALGVLAGGLAHDFNNLLTVIIGNSELLQERLGADEEGQRLAQATLSAALAGADLARLLVTSSRGHSKLAEFCVADLARELGGVFERSLGPKITLEIETEPDGWSVRADRALLASVLLNLVFNARQAMPQGGTLTLAVRNTVNPESTPNAGECVEILVRDTGEGMAPTVLERAFEPFFTTKQSGTGLGLAMVRDFATQARGHIAIRSASGEGTEVRLYLPRAPLQLGLPHLQSEPDLRARAGETVFLFESGTDFAGLLQRQLLALGYAVRCVEPQQLAADTFAGCTNALALLDQAVLGAGNLIKLVRRLRRSQPSLKFLIVTDEQHDSAELKMSGTLLFRPFTGLDLARRVRAAIDGRL